MVAGKTLSIASTLNASIGKKSNLIAGFSAVQGKNENYAAITDLLGATFHEDIDAFSNTLNDVNGNLQKRVGERFTYNFDTSFANYSVFAQGSTSYKKWTGFLTAEWSSINYQRRGRFVNERYLDNSLGNSRRLDFTTLSFKSGIGYQISGRHWLNLHLGKIEQAPLLRNSFVNPRENNKVVEGLQKETLSLVDLNYHIRLARLVGRVSLFYADFKDATAINFFFVDAGVGSDFVQEVTTGIDTRHMGVEAGLEYQLSADVKVSLAANIGDYRYANNPNVQINFDTAGQEEPINQEGEIDLGEATINGLKLARGPQKAFALGFEYRDPDYWWVGVTANYLANNYANISKITRTASFSINPDTGEPFSDATPENIAAVLRQEPLDNFYLLNIVGGKSWLVNNKYISVFLSVNNAFNTTFRTGGYEQSRNGNFRQLQQDNLRNNPTFAPKFWYGFGRTYFLNFAISF